MYLCNVIAPDKALFFSLNSDNIFLIYSGKHMYPQHRFLWRNKITITWISLLSGAMHIVYALMLWLD